MQIYSALNIESFYESKGNKWLLCAKEIYQSIFVVRDKNFISVSIFVAPLITNGHKRKRIGVEKSREMIFSFLGKELSTEILFNDTDFPRSFFRTCSTTEIESISRLKTRGELFSIRYTDYSNDFWGCYIILREKNINCSYY